MLSDASAADSFWKNIVTKEEIAQDEQFLLLPQCFQLYLIVKLSFVEIVQVCVNKFWKSPAAELLYEGKG